MVIVGGNGNSCSGGGVMGVVLVLVVEIVDGGIDGDYGD